MKYAKKLKTLQQKAKDRGLQAFLIPEQIGVNPKTGNIVKLRNRNTLYVLNERGEPIVHHMSGLPRTTNARIEKYVEAILDEDDSKNSSED